MIGTAIMSGGSIRRPGRIRGPADFQPGKSGIFVKLDGAIADSQRMRPRTGLTVIALALAGAAGGIAINSSTTNSAPAASSASTTPPPVPPPPSSETGCTSGIYGHAIEVTIYGASCVAWDRDHSGSGQFWRVLAEPREEHLVCSMSDGGPLIEVRDSGEAMYGSQICAALTARGWSESPGPGVEREEQRRQEAAAAKVQQEAREAKEATQSAEADAREHAQHAREAEQEAHKQAAEQHQAEAQQHSQEAQERAQAQREQQHADAEQHQAEREAAG